MNKTLHTLGALTIAAALNLFTTACSSDDIMVNDEPQTEQPAAVKTYQLSIPATMAGDGQTRVVSFDGTNCSRTFSYNERVNVYNVTRQTVLGNELAPQSISSDGKNCTLTGAPGYIESNDVVRLFYNLNSHNVIDIDKNFFYYQGQNGTQSGVIDGAEATVTVSEYLSTQGLFSTTTTASFQPVQSMFRFQFKDESNNAIKVKLLKISSTNNALDIYYYPLDDSNTQNPAGDYYVTLGSATTDYIYAALRINESRSNGDMLTFTVIDNDGNSYQGTRAVPNGGLKNGKYYYNSQAIQLTKQESTAPDITWTNPSTPVTPNANKVYNISGDDITISGISNGYSFSLTDGAPFTVRLNNLTAWYNAADPYSPFIDNNGNLILEVNGTNTINCKGSYQAIKASYEGNTLKFKGNGTLTVTTQYLPRCGLYSNNYNDNNNAYTNTSEADVSSQLAAPGYTVTRSAVINNGDDTHTWTYTVAPTVISGKFSINNRGNQVYFSPGNLQATTTDLGATWTWHFAENQWDYIGANAANNSISEEPGKVSVNGTIDLFGWVGASATLTGAAQYGIIKTVSLYETTHYGNVAGENLKSNWGNTIGSGWRTLTPSEWDYLLNTRNGYRYVFATINSNNGSDGVKGLILIPDNFFNNIKHLNFYNEPSNWDSNVLTIEEWAAFAAKGCVFLPAAGSRSHNSAVYSGSGCYWSSSSPSDPSDSNAWFKAFYLYFGTGNYKLKVDNSTTRIYGHSVRLVHPVE